MKKMIKGIVFGIWIATASATALAVEKATQEEAIALVKKAVAYMQTNGREKAIA